MILSKLKSHFNYTELKGVSVSEGHGLALVNSWRPNSDN